MQRLREWQVQISFQDWIAEPITRNGEGINMMAQPSQFTPEHEVRLNT